MSADKDKTRKARHKREAYGHRLRRMRDHGMKPPLSGQADDMHREASPAAIVECGWGRLLFGQTFRDADQLVEALRAEGADRRDIAVYVRDPHVVLARAPQELFLDPSHMYRLDLSIYRAGRKPLKGFFVRRLTSQADAEAVNRIYSVHHMVPVPPEFFWQQRDSRLITYFIAEDEITGEVLGTVTGIDHARAFNDPERGASLWCLAVDPQASHPGIGEALVRRLAEHFSARGAVFMDLSVMHDNDSAIALYDKLGFKRVPYFTVKRKNPINEKLFSGPDSNFDQLNPYARIIVDEALRRGIHVEVTDADGGFFRLSFGGRSLHCRESLSELTSGVAVSICDDKAVTRRIVERAGVKVPEQMEATDRKTIEDFLKRHERVVVKPARGEQGRGVSVGLENVDDIEHAITAARTVSDRVLIEQCVEGEDLRLVVIDHRVVAAAIRRPARIIGDGNASIRALVEHQSRRRAAATGGESRIPLDEETERCVSAAGFSLDDVPGKGTEIYVRKAANLHTGGTIHDVTGEVHPRLIEAATAVTRAIDIPVAGIDLIVRSPRGESYAFIEANERPGLANHEPQPTAERFIDLLFPLSMPTSVREVQREHA